MQRRRFSRRFSVLFNETLPQRKGRLHVGFYTAVGASDNTVDSGTVPNAMELQGALGKLRLVSGHFQGKLVAIDPHRVRSHYKRQMRMRVEKHESRPFKMAQTFTAFSSVKFEPRRTWVVGVERSESPEYLSSGGSPPVPRGSTPATPSRIWNYWHGSNK